MTLKIDGQCHCGFIHYEAEADPEKTLICNCTDCQALSGSAFRTVVPAKEGTFRLLSGEPKVYVKKGESGTPREQSFCPQCGSPIYSAVVGEGPKVYGLRVGTIRQREKFVPTIQLWSRSAQPWTDILSAVPKLETQPVFSSTGSFR